MSFELVVEQALGDVRVSACCGQRQVEDQGQVQRVGANGQGFVQDAVAADAVDVDAEVVHLGLDVDVADGLGSEGGSARDEDVSVRAVRPGGASVVEPGPQRPVGVPGPAAEKPTDIAAQVVTKAVLGATGVGKPAPAP